MDGESSLPLERDAVTNCLNWTGSFSSDGYPVFYGEGEQHLASRVFFEDLICPLPDWVRLHRVCPSPSCVTPFHYVLQGPRRAAERLGYCADDVRGIALLLRAGRQREPGETPSWDVARLAKLGFQPAQLSKWAARLGMPPVVVLAAYASLVRASAGAVQRAIRTGRAEVANEPQPSPHKVGQSVSRQEL